MTESGEPFVIGDLRLVIEEPVPNRKSQITNHKSQMVHQLMSSSESRRVNQPSWGMTWMGRAFAQIETCKRISWWGS